MHPLPSEDDHEQTGTAERRSQQREPVEAQVTVQVETRDFGGTSKNVSQAGIFFFSKDHLRVSVQVDDGSGRRTVHGRLVRVERMDAETTGFAIEFDH